MGLSILIPVYNFDVTALVKTLAEQLQQTGKPGEIILFDDSSAPAINAINNKLVIFPFIKYQRNEKNEGRTNSRRKLSSLASFENLLFLDCDSRIVHNNFITSYFDEEKQGTELVTGGRIYSSVPPTDCKLRLHWKYGSRRESDKGAAFMSSNFMIRKSLFEQLDFSFQLPGYGHEDTWWGIQFKNFGIKVKKINNPVLHDALEDSETYLKKSENAVMNLLLLEKKVDITTLKNEVKIYRWYRRLRSSGFAGLYLLLEKIFHKAFYKNLLSCRPRLFYFDCYRLAILIRLAKKK